jgi:hypothetical protein
MAPASVSVPQEQSTSTQRGSPMTQRLSEAKDKTKAPRQHHAAPLTPLPAHRAALALLTPFKFARVVLPSLQREALNGELAGIPHVVLAEQLSMSRNALYKLTHDARRKLKAGLLAAGITATDAAALFE